MDNKNTIIGVILIVALIGTWLFIQSKNQPEEPKKDTTTEQTTSNSGNSSTSSNIEPVPETSQFVPKLTVGDTLEDGTIVTDSLIKVRTNSALSEQFGDFAPAGAGEEEQIHVITDKLDFYLNTKGGHAQPIFLNRQTTGFQTYDSLPLPIFSDNKDNAFAIQFLHLAGNGVKQIDSRQLFFTPDISEREVTVSGDEEKTIRMRAMISEDEYLEQVYVIKGDAYDFGYHVNFHNINNRVKDGYYDLLWNNHVPVTEKEKEMMTAKGGVHWRAGGSLDDLGKLDEDEVEEESIKEQPDWVAYKSQFFVNAIIAEDGLLFDQADVSQIVSPKQGVMADMSTTFEVPLSSLDQTSETHMRIYAGPLEYETLSSYENDLEGVMRLGWGPLKLINKYFFLKIFKWLEAVNVPYWLIIVLLAVFVKLLLSPLTFRTFVNQAKMRVVNTTPEIKALEDKYKDDPTKLQQAKMGVYNKMGVSPLGGCLPMLLQYPFLISLFFLFPEMISLRQVSFLWAHDLSTYDSILDLPFRIPGYGDHVSLFCLLMAVSIYVYTFINQKNQPAVNQQMKFLPYMMPLVFIIFLNNYAAGLSFYYFVSNILNIAQTTITKAFINDDKVLAKLHEDQKKRKAKGGKKGGLSGWLEKQQKKQEQMMKDARKNTGKGGGGSSKGKGKKRR